jgi:hypothetical protein
MCENIVHQIVFFRDLDSDLKLSRESEIDSNFLLTITLLLSFSLVVFEQSFHCCEFGH